MKSVIELQAFETRALKVFGEEGKSQIIDKISESPKLGKQVSGLGGIRKYECQDFGGTRAEYAVYFHPGSRNKPIVLIDVLKIGSKQVSEKIIDVLLYGKFD